MKKSVKITMSILFCFLLVLPTFQTGLFAQEKKVDPEKIYKEIAGDWEYIYEGQAILITYFVEDGVLRAQQEGDTDIVELIPVVSKDLAFEVHDEDGQYWEIFFSRDEEGKITKGNIVTEGIDVEGTKIIEGGSFDFR